MSSNNPDITASDIISDVENRLGDTNLDASDYLPWISYAYTKLFHAISSAGSRAKEEIFGASETFNLSAGSSSVSINTNIPRFGGFLRVEVKYGGTDDTMFNKATRLTSVAYGKDQDELTTQYNNKARPLYRKLGDSLIIIPTPPTTDSGTPQATVWYVKRPYQITDSADIIDIPYRFIYPIPNYVHSKAIIAENEDFGQANLVEERFERELQQIVTQVVNEFDEYDGTNAIAYSESDAFNQNPLGNY